MYLYNDVFTSYGELEKKRRGGPLLRLKILIINYGKMCNEDFGEIWKIPRDTRNCVITERGRAFYKNVHKEIAT